MIRGGGERGSLIEGDQGGGGHLRGIAHAQMLCGASGNMFVVVVALVTVALFPGSAFYERYTFV